jgi:hypothetical protein
MAVHLHVRATHADEERYRALLNLDWSKNTLESTLALLWGTIASSAMPAKIPWQKVLVFDEQRVISGRNLDRTILNPIMQFAPFFHRSPLPELPSTFSARKTRSTAIAETTWTYLIVQLLASLKGDTGIFCDSQSLLFLCAIDSLLPQLKGQNLSAEHDCLVNAMYLHAVFVWRDQQPSHMYYLLSALMDYLGDPAQKRSLLQCSFDLTPKDDHSYLTKAQALWSDMLDQKQYPEAMQFILSVARDSPRDNVPELTEMLIETGRMQTE